MDSTTREEIAKALAPAAKIPVCCSHFVPSILGSKSTLTRFVRFRNYSTL